MNKQNLPWSYSSAANYWYGFGRYYAMFPLKFASDAVEGLTLPGELVLDPFCGRGNGPFAAVALGRPSLGIDINPVAWLFTSVKLAPERNVNLLISRLNQIASARRPQDRQGRSRFERMAWSPSVRAFLRAARRELNWETSVTDRTLMGFIVLHMQDKLGAGLSNSLWPTIACSPTYAVSWWKRNGFSKPPDVDPVALLTAKIQRRYKYGNPNQARGAAILSDARDVLKVRRQMNAKLLITSPPYNGVTDYWNDHWIRLWMLGHKMRKDWKRTTKYANRADYQKLIRDVFQASKKHMTADANILIRSDRRRQTEQICLEALSRVWPHRDLLIRSSDAPSNGISVYHGRGGSKAKEIDILIPGRGGLEWGTAQGFRVFKTSFQKSLHTHKQAYV